MSNENTPHDLIIRRATCKWDGCLGNFEYQSFFNESSGVTVKYRPCNTCGKYTIHGEDSKLITYIRKKIINH